jgi:hypothetical protein
LLLLGKIDNFLFVNLAFDLLCITIHCRGLHFTINIHIVVFFLFGFSRTFLYNQVTSWIDCHHFCKGKFFFCFHSSLVPCCFFAHFLLQPNFKLFARSFLVVLLYLALISLLFPCSSIHRSCIFAWKLKLALCFNIVQNSPTKHFLTIPFHIVVNHGYNTRLCDFRHGIYDITPNRGLDIQFNCPWFLFRFELCCHGYLHCHSKCKFYVVCSYNQWFLYVLISKCFAARIRVLGEAKKHNLVFQVPIHQIRRWPTGGELQDVEVHTLSKC